jgi:PilZ domain
MLEASFPVRPVRSQYRHELRTLTYLTLDDGNGGIVRNLNHDGAALQVVSPLRPEQRVRLRFQLKGSRLRPFGGMDACGEVTWADSKGACGIRFIDLPARSRNQIDEWILSDLLTSLAVATNTIPILESFPASAVSDEIDDSDERNASSETDGLILSADPRPAIRLEPTLPMPVEPLSMGARKDDPSLEKPRHKLSPHARPSARTLARAVDVLAISAGLLLFAVIFLSIAHEVPEWQLTLSMVLLAVPFFAGAYWTLFALFGRSSLGDRVAQSASFVEHQKEKEYADRFR